VLLGIQRQQTPTKPPAVSEFRKFIVIPAHPPFVEAMLMKTSRTSETSAMHFAILGDTLICLVCVIVTTESGLLDGPRGLFGAAVLRHYDRRTNRALLPANAPVISGPGQDDKEKT
jgi:hypothetical protein